MKYRTLGQAGLTVSEIGFGAWGIGGRSAGDTSYGDTDDGRSRLALARAHDRGITFYDTAPAYGDGHSEELLGEVFAGMRDRVVIATKAGLDSFTASPDFSPTALRRSLEGSLRRLRCDYVDLFQLHNPPPNLFVTSPESYAALETLVREGKVRAFGASVKSPDDAVTMLAQHSLAAVQVNLNMLDIRAVEAGLLNVASRAGAGIIARTPLSFGFLSGAVTADTRFPEGDHRRRWSKDQLARWVDGAAMMHEAAAVPPDHSRSQAALRFCLSFPDISTVIPGILSPEEADENAAASLHGPLADQARGAIVALNRKQDFYARASGAQGGLR